MTESFYRSNSPTRGLQSTRITFSVTVGAMAAYAIGMLDMPVLHRRTVRALLPETGIIRPKNAGASVSRIAKGHGTGRNRTSEKLGKALWGWENAGFLQRGEEFLRILDSRALLDIGLRCYADAGITPNLEFDAACREVREGLRAPINAAYAEQRRLELLRIQRLMEEAPTQGANWSGRDSVRHLPHGSTI